MNYNGLKEDKRLVKVVPSARQIAYENMEFFCFIHFTVNTFTGSEWGDGTEPESVFNPTELEARQWAKTAAEGGMKGLILTCKHHDGFCLWPSKYTEHSIKNSPYKNGKGDIVRETAEACREFGLKFGVYLSPWDRNNSSYGKGKEYDDYYLNQLTELLTEYGDIFVIWLDGACGEGPNDILGVEEERGFNLNTDKYNWDENRKHFILADSEGEVDFGEGKKNIFALPETEILISQNQEVQMAVKSFGKGRGVYISGLPYSFKNSRVLYRAVLWSANAENMLHCWYSSNYNVEVHAYVKNRKYCVVNNTYESQDTTVYIGDGSSFELHMEPNEIKWYQIQ